MANTNVAIEAVTDAGQAVADVGIQLLNSVLR
jgi:hypothetical protein